ncbi:MAG: BON domain-containing protein, partial [Candidatus Acidiferrum sp.]
MQLRRLQVCILACFVFLAVACNRANDDTITTEIKAKMFSEPALKAASVEVSSKDGVVTLTGVLPDEAARLAAQNIAAKTKGVRQVIVSLTLPSPAPAAAVAPAPPLPAEPTPVPPKLQHKKKAARKETTEPAPATPAADQNTSAEAAPPATPS